MTTALRILMAHRYGQNGGAPAVCLDLAGAHTTCKWKARRGADGYGIQHIRHQAELIAQAYDVDLLPLAQLQSVRDYVAGELNLLDAMPPNADFQRGRAQVLGELAQILDLEKAPA